MAEIRVFHFWHVNAVHLGKATIEDISERIGDVERADEAGEPWDIPGDRDCVLEVVVLLEDLVYSVNGIPGSDKHAQEVLQMILQAFSVAEGKENFAWKRDAIQSSLGNHPDGVDKEHFSDDKLHADEDESEKERSTDKCQLLSSVLVELVRDKVSQDADRLEGQDSNRLVLEERHHQFEDEGKDDCRRELRCMSWLNAKLLICLKLTCFICLFNDLRIVMLVWYSFASELDKISSRFDLRNSTCLWFRAVNFYELFL